jgi:hypothetical protein
MVSIWCFWGLGELSIEKLTPLWEAISSKAIGGGTVDVFEAETVSTVATEERKISSRMKMPLPPKNTSTSSVRFGPLTSPPKSLPRTGPLSPRISLVASQ